MKPRRTVTPAPGNKSLSTERPKGTDITTRALVSELSTLEGQMRRAGGHRPAVRRPELFLGNTARVIPYVGSVSVRRTRTARPPAQTQMYDEVPKITPSKATRMHWPLSLEYQQPPVNIPMSQVMERIIAQRPEREERRRELLSRIGSGLGICLSRCTEQDARAQDLAAAESPQLIANDVAGQNEPVAAAAPETVEWPIMEFDGGTLRLDDNSDLDGNFSGNLNLGAAAKDKLLPVRPSADISTMTPATLFGPDAVNYTPPEGGISLFQPFDRATAE